MEITVRKANFRYEVLSTSVYLEVKKVLDWIDENPDNQLIAEDITRRVMQIFVEETRS